MKHDLVPKGRLKVCPGLRRGPFSAVPAGPTAGRDRLGRPFKSNPGLASWAKFSRPFGTKFLNPGSHTRSKAPVVRLFQSFMAERASPPGLTRIDVCIRAPTLGGPSRPTCHGDFPVTAFSWQRFS